MELKFILEALLFNAQKPLTSVEVRGLLVAAAKSELPEDVVAAPYKKVTVDEITAALEGLASEHEAAQRSFRLVCVAGAWQVVTQPEYAPWLRVLLGLKPRPPRLSQAALETLAIVAYRQPMTRAEIEQIRGVSVDGVMQTLIERGLVVSMGRAEVIGRPTTYGTTTVFLEYFGLGSLEELPAADELRRIVVERPPSLATVDANLATVPQPELFTPTTGEISTEGTAAPQTPAPAADAAPVKPSEAEATAPDAEASQPEDAPKPEADVPKSDDETPSAPESDGKNS
jgi:segregation and condensation protein B